MVMYCFIEWCIANKWRYNKSNRKTTTFFRFPKSSSLLEEWKKVLPPRTALARTREPDERSYLCSLHFKSEDVVRYFEYIGFHGLPYDEVVRLERGKWKLKPTAVPCYFNNDNPDASQLVRLINKTPKTIKDSSCSSRHMEKQKKAATNVSAVLRESSQVSDITEDSTICSKISVTAKTLLPKPSVRSMMLDHDYILTASDPTEDYQGVNPPKKLRFDPYTIEQLQQDVLDIILPQNWTFMQNDDECSTEFMLCRDDGSIVKSIRFPGTCRPCVTVNSTVMAHKAVNSKQEIQELLLLVKDL